MRRCRGAPLISRRVLQVGVGVYLAGLAAAAGTRVVVVVVVVRSYIHTYIHAVEPPATRPFVLRWPLSSGEMTPRTCMGWSIPQGRDHVRLTSGASLPESCRERERERLQLFFGDPTNPNLPPSPCQRFGGANFRRLFILSFSLSLFFFPVGPEAEAL